MNVYLSDASALFCCKASLTNWSVYDLTVLQAAKNPFGAYKKYKSPSLTRVAVTSEALLKDCENRSISCLKLSTRLSCQELGGRTTAGGLLCLENG